MATLPVEPKDGQPGSDLSLEQRECAELEVMTGLKSDALSDAVHVVGRTVRRWQTTTEYRRYLTLLTTEATTEARRLVQATVARNAQELIDTAIRLGKGTGKRGKPAHPYQQHFISMLLDRVSGKPAQATIEAGVQVPTEHGPVTIIFKAEA